LAARVNRAHDEVVGQFDAHGARENNLDVSKRTRRMTRPTNALFSKKMKNHAPFRPYNFARIHEMHPAYDGRRCDRSALGSGEYGRPAEGVGASN
jgi:hypothetical protein